MNIRRANCPDIWATWARRRPMASWISRLGSRFYIGGAWHTFDARNNVPRIGRVLIARGRDAADVRHRHHLRPQHPGKLQGWTDEVI